MNKKLNVSKQPGETYGTFRSYTVFVDANDFKAKRSIIPMEKVHLKTGLAGLIFRSG